MKYSLRRSYLYVRHRGLNVSVSQLFPVLLSVLLLVNAIAKTHDANACGRSARLTKTRNVYTPAVSQHLGTFLLRRGGGTDSLKGPQNHTHKWTRVNAQVLEDGDGSDITTNDEPIIQKSKLSSSFLLQAAMWIATANVLINTFRPDPDLHPWQMRVPRIVWELVIAIMAGTLTHSPLHSVPYVVPILLSVMLITTSSIDILVWSPIFAFVSAFCEETSVCDSSMIVVIQCLITGFIYALTGISIIVSLSSPSPSQRRGFELQQRQSFLEDMVQEHSLSLVRQQEELLNRQNRLLKRIEREQSQRRLISDNENTTGQTPGSQ